jgi:hypothetical protein
MSSRLEGIGGPVQIGFCGRYSSDARDTKSSFYEKVPDICFLYSYLCFTLYLVLILFSANRIKGFKKPQEQATTCRQGFLKFLSSTNVWFKEKNLHKQVLNYLLSFYNLGVTFSYCSIAVGKSSTVYTDRVAQVALEMVTSIFPNASEGGIVKVGDVPDLFNQVVILCIKKIKIDHILTSNICLLIFRRKRNRYNFSIPDGTEEEGYQPDFRELVSF